MIVYITIFISSVILTLFMKKINIIDNPNHRSSHEKPIPTAGGISFVLPFYALLLYLYNSHEIDRGLFFALFSSLPLFIVSFLDDIFDLNIYIRLGVQIVSTILAFYFLGIFSHFSLWLVALFFISMIWLINLYNFLDGIDGYAGSEAIFVSIGAYFIYHDRLFIFLAIGVFAFLIFNWQRASIFMGDSGSIFLGYIFGVFALYHYDSFDDILVWIMLLGIFVFDGTLTLLRRFKNGEVISKPHKKHYFQRLVQSGYSHQKTTLLALLFNIVVYIFLYLSYGSNLLYILFIIYIFAIFILSKWVDKKRGFDV